jgi:Family of unknown function (DUF5681)
MDTHDAESTPQKHRGLREPWKPGESGNPAGRPKGSRNKLSEEFVAEIYADWCEHGAAALQTVKENRPEVYVKVVASLLPREVHAEITGPTHEDRVTELMERLAQLDAENAMSESTYTRVKTYEEEVEVRAMIEALRADNGKLLTRAQSRLPVEARGRKRRRKYLGTRCVGRRPRAFLF